MSTQQSASPGGLDFLVRNRKATGYGLVAGAVLLSVAAVVLAVKFRWDYAAVCVGAGWLGVVLLVAGVYQLVRDPNAGPEPDATRLMVLAVAGLAGLITTLVGVALAWKWWDIYLGW